MISDSKNVGFLDLPSEIIVQIVYYLSEEDNAIVSLVSKFFYTFTSNDTLWEKSFFYKHHIPNRHIGESKKIIAIKMMHKYIEAFAPIFFDSFTNEQLDQELVINNNLINLENKELLPIISNLFMNFYDRVKEIQQMETDSCHKFIPSKYKENVVKFASIIKMSMFAIKNYNFFKKAFFSKTTNKVEPILSKCLCNPKNIQDLEKIKLVLDLGADIRSSDVICKAIWELNAPYEVIEFLEMERIKSGPAQSLRTLEQLKVIDQILCAAKQQFKGHKSERSLLIFILESVVTYRGDHITTHNDEEKVLAVDFLREQCKQHQIYLQFYH